MLNWKDSNQAISIFEDYWENISKKIIIAFENENQNDFITTLEKINQDLDFKIYDYLLSRTVDLQNVESALSHLQDYFWGRLELSQSNYLLELFQKEYFNWKNVHSRLRSNPNISKEILIAFEHLEDKTGDEFKALALKFEESLCRLASNVIYQAGIDFIKAFNKQIVFLSGEFSFYTPGIQADWEYFSELLELSQREGIFSLEDLEIPIAYDYLKKPISQIVEGLSPENLHFILSQVFSKAFSELLNEENLFLTAFSDIKQGTNPYILKSKMASIIGIPENHFEKKDSVPIVDDLLLDSPERNKPMELKELAEYFIFWAERARREGLLSLEYYFQSIYFTDDIEILFTALLNGMPKKELLELVKFVFLVRKNQKQVELKFWHLALLLLQHPQASYIAREINFFIQEMSLACKKNSGIKLDQFQNQNIEIKLLGCQYENATADYNMIKNLLINKINSANIEELAKPEYLKAKIMEKQNWKKKKKESNDNFQELKKKLIKIQAQKNPALETLEFLLDKQNSYSFTQDLISIYLKKEKQKGELLKELSIQSQMEIAKITEKYLGKVMKINGSDSEIIILRQMIQTGLLHIDVISQLPRKERLHFLREFFYLQGANEEDPLEFKKSIIPSDFSYLAMSLKDCDEGIQGRIFEVLNDEEIRLIKTTMEYI